MKGLYVDYYKSPLGLIKIAATNEGLLSLTFVEKPETGESVGNRITTETVRQLDQYFRRERKTFDLPLQIEGYSDFLKKVWQALSKIPYAETRNYSEVAAVINNPAAVRAVGNACGKNPLPIVIPCHRVLRKDGALGGFSAGEGIKEKLLALEKSHRQND
jgi:O-6-methylguanine DNA methyltransferase